MISTGFSSSCKQTLIFPIMATHSSILASRIPWTEEPGGLLSMGSHRVGYEWSNLACMHALEKEMATHFRILAWRILGTEEPGGLPFMGSHRVGHDWSDLAAAAALQKRCYQAHLQWLLHLALILHYAFNRRYSRDCISEITWRGCRTTGCRAHPHSFWLVGLERSWKFTFPNKFPGDANTANHESHFEAQDSISMPSASYCLPIFRARAT